MGEVVPRRLKEGGNIDPPIADRRTMAVLVCDFGNCAWAIKTADAEHLAEMWKAHAEYHWHRPSLATRTDSKTFRAGGDDG